MPPPHEPSESRSHDSSGAPLGGIVGLTMLERGYEFRCVALIVAHWFSQMRSTGFDVPGSPQVVPRTTNMMNPAKRRSRYCRRPFLSLAQSMVPRNERA